MRIGLSFELFLEWGLRVFLEARCGSEALPEAKMLMEAAGSKWAGVITTNSQGEFVSSIRLEDQKGSLLVEGHDDCMARTDA